MNRLCLLLLVCLVSVSCTSTTGNQKKPDYLGDSGKSSADVYVELGVGYMRQGNDAAALENLKKAVKTDPRSSDAQGIIAVLYEKLGEKELAEKHYRKALSINAGNSRAQNNYGRFLCSDKKIAEADLHFKLAYEDPLNQRKWIALTNAAQCQLKNGNKTRAEQLFRQTLQINPRFSPALAGMAKISLAQKKYLSVRGYLQRFREVGYHSAETLWMGIQSEHELGDRDAIASYVVILHSKFPDSEEVRLLDKTFPQYR